MDLTMVIMPIQVHLTNTVFGSPLLPLALGDADCPSMQAFDLRRQVRRQWNGCIEERATPRMQRKRAAATDSPAERIHEAVPRVEREAAEPRLIRTF
jgi:hypothetical protein